MRNRSDVLQHCDFEADIAESADCGFTSGPRTFDINFYSA